ncbi:MAG: conjugal transfer protein [Neisseria sp.]|nr:conjugal transfer protein [Neisseria sp.]
MSEFALLPETRPYPSQPVKNELLIQATRIAEAGAGNAKASETMLAEQIEMMLCQNHYLGLSVALSMAPDAASYAALYHALDRVLRAQHEDEVQWFALPVVLVAGCKKPVSLSLESPAAALSACLENYPHTRALSHMNAVWLPRLVRAQDLAAVDAGQWFAAKKNTEAAEALAAKLTEAAELSIEPEQSVHVLFAVGYGSAALNDILGKNLQDAALPLMQVWQESLKTDGLTLFANPLSADTPMNALNEGNHMRLRMALDVFAANAIRAVRLQSPRVGVVVGAQEGGRLLFGFNAAESHYELQPQIFAWPLSPMERIETVQRDFLDLMAECQVDNVRLLADILPENKELPTFAEALKMNGSNPFLAV